ncbi:MAG TPA: histidine kinase, partial [Chitinophagaceae bacterium]|nr:histidine kinase [Chitinophagaceae bacterium]
MSKSPLSGFRFRFIFILFWLAIIADHTLVLHWFGINWKISIIDSLISNALLVLAGLLVMNTLRYYLPRRERYVHLLAWAIFLTVIIILLNGWILNSIFANENEYVLLLNHSLAIRVSLYFLLLCCLILVSVLWYHQQEMKEQDEIKKDAEKLAKEAELFKLRQQLQPHFLFNSLNSINALIGSRPEEARKMVQQLSDFLRGTIKKEETQWVTLKEEMQYLQLYLDIEKVRFGNRLATVIETDEITTSMKLPALLLQPIVENAIKFGLYDTTGETVIKILTAKEEKNLVIKVM